MLLEICAANLPSALAAQRAGAHRIELCAALDVGGLTPSPGLLREVRRRVDLPIHVLVRPREGHFCYEEMEIEMMLEDIRCCHELGMQGVVIGALTPDKQLNLPVLKRLRRAAGPLDVTYHRAFDFVADPAAALEQLVKLGFQRILTSGQAASAYEGRFLIKKLVEQAAGRIAVMPGAGIRVENSGAIARVTGAQEFHLSARRWVGEGQEEILPGLAGGYWVSDETKIREVLAALNSLL